MAPQVPGERPSKRPHGHPSSDPWNLPVPSGIVHVFCPFRVRRNRLKADRNASNRLRPLLRPPGPRRLPPLRILPQALVSSGRGKPAPGQRKGQSTSWPQGVLLRITVISTTGHCQRERGRERERADREEGAAFGFLVSGSWTWKPQIRKQRTSVQRSLCARGSPPGGPAPRQGGRTLKAHSSGKMCFQEEIMAQFLSSPGLSRPCSLGRFQNPGVSNTLSGDKVSLLPPFPVSRVASR